MLDGRQGTPAHAAPDPAEPDPDALAVGDQQRRTRVDECVQVEGGDEAEHDDEQPVEHGTGLGGPAEVGDRHRGRTGPDRRGDAAVAAYLDDVRRGGQVAAHAPVL